jgi:hypothetical protein
MMSEPLACALPEDEAERQARKTRSAIGASVLRHAEIDGGMRLWFPGDEQTAADVGAVIEAESRCCPFLDMAIERRNGELELTVTGPPEAAPMIELLFR